MVEEAYTVGWQRRQIYDVDSHSNGMAVKGILKTAGVLVFLLASLLFFILLPRSPTDHPFQGRSLLVTSVPKCTVSNFTSTDGLLNYSAVHLCLFGGKLFLSVPILGLILLLQFYILVITAQHRFSVVVNKLSTHLNLSPSMGAVTLLSLGNGAPDVFSSVAAVSGGQPRTGFGAILSAGTFVSAFVVGFVAIHAAPFAVDPAPFIRDVMFYLTAALFMFYVYLSAEIYVWQAVGFLLYYIFFVGIVFFMDLGYNGNASEKNSLVIVTNVEKGTSKEMKEMDIENREFIGMPGMRSKQSGFLKFLKKVAYIWEVPVWTLLKLTIPETSGSEWSRFYQSANIVLCPLLLLYSCKSFMSFNHPVMFLLPNAHIPLWLIALFGSSSLAILHYIIEKEPPKSDQISTLMVAFVMSVFWISTTAGELLNCLAALSNLLKLPQSLLGLTVLAWGNSVGDLVADVAVAKAGRPAMAMAGCFAGPMFNMLFGLGTALTIQTVNSFPEAYVLHFHLSIVVAFVFLMLSLMGSLLVVTWCRFRVPKSWGLCLVALYVVFMGVSLVLANFT